MEKDLRYVIQVHRRNKLMDKVSGAMSKIFDQKQTLVIVEALAEITSKKSLTKSEIKFIEDSFLPKAREIFKEDSEIDKVEVLPYEKSLIPRALREAKKT